MSFVELLGLYLAYKILKKDSKKRPRRRRRMWVRPWLTKRDQYSHMVLLRELEENDPDDFKNYLRMDQETYQTLLNLVTPLIQKEETVMRKSISPDERLVATLRYLATGRRYSDLKFSCAFSKSSLCYIIPETCYAIYQVLKNEYLRFPTTEQEWLDIATQFESRWQFPFCLGSIDGKHIQIKPPAGSGSFFFNYKKTHSIVLMAIANANYEFILCDVGTNGRISDGGVIENTTFWSKLNSGTLNLPTVREREGEDTNGLNYVFIADEAFALRPDLMKPYNRKELTDSKRIYNYRLSRARRVVENAFGILVNRFRIFEKPIDLDLPNIDIVVLACCLLHNFLRRKCGAAYIPPEALDEEDIANKQLTVGYRTNDNNDMINLQRGQNRNASGDAKDVRDKFKDWFNGPGAALCPWQWDMVNVVDNVGYSNDGDLQEVDNDLLRQRLAEEEIDDVEPMQ